MPPDNWCTKAFAKYHLKIFHLASFLSYLDNFETFSQLNIFHILLAMENNAPSWKIRSVLHGQLMASSPNIPRHMNYQIPATTLRRVLLPQPDGPTTAKNSPPFICKVKSSKDNLFHKSMELQFISSFLP